MPYMDAMGSYENFVHQLGYRLGPHIIGPCRQLGILPPWSSGGFRTARGAVVCHENTKASDLRRSTVRVLREMLGVTWIPQQIQHQHVETRHCLVLSTSEKYVSSSVGMILYIYMWENKIDVPNHQPGGKSTQKNYTLSLVSSSKILSFEDLGTCTWDTWEGPTANREAQAAG